MVASIIRTLRAFFGVESRPCWLRIKRFANSDKFLYDSVSMFRFYKPSLIAAFLLFIMAFTHGGGFVLASSCVSKAKTSCCAMESCCCVPAQCQCPGHHQTHLNAAQESVVVQIANPDCSPIKKLLSVGFDTSPIVLPHCVELVFLGDSLKAPDCSKSLVKPSHPELIFHPPQIA